MAWKKTALPRYQSGDAWRRKGLTPPPPEAWIRRAQQISQGGREVPSELTSEEYGERLLTVLRAHADKRGVTLRDVTWTTAENEFVVRPDIRFSDGRGVRTGVAIKPQKGSPDDVYDWIVLTLVQEIDRVVGIHASEKAEAKRLASIRQRRITPDFTDPIVGFRSWNVRPAGGGQGLYPIGAGKGAWNTDGEWLHSRCVAGSHASPHPSCHCGYNAWFSVRHLNNVRWPAVAGAIIGKGVIEVHADRPSGFRAEYAKPVALTYIVPGDRHNVSTLGRELGLPVVPPEGLDAYVQEYGIVIDAKTESRLTYFDGFEENPGA